jgi:Cytochrome c7 and related cytochrome c
VTGARRWASSLALVCALLVALVAACAERHTAARFPHKVHLVGLHCEDKGKPACLSCNSCHAPSQQGRAGKLPQQELCESCHKTDAREVLPVLSVVPPRPNGEIAFNHDQHLGMPGIQGQCVKCHGGVLRDERSSLPPMSQCFTCHEHEQQWQRAECTPCHAQKDLAKTLPQTFLRHDQAFARHHGAAVALQQNLCQSCHTQSQCQSCHDASQDLSVEQRRPERIESNQVHRGDFLTRHAIEAKSEPARCASCHTPQSCDSCHAARGVSGNILNGRNPHPPEWVGSNVGSSNFHGREARRDILACASCHDQGPATNCIRCHKVGAYGGNPHPGGWKSTRSIASEMCRYCHG